jgi:hypothetical protein
MLHMLLLLLRSQHCPGQCVSMPRSLARVMYVLLVLLLRMAHHQHLSPSPFIACEYVPRMCQYLLCRQLHDVDPGPPCSPGLVFDTIQGWMDMARTLTFEDPGKAAAFSKVRGSRRNRVGGGGGWGRRLDMYCSVFTVQRCRAPCMHDVAIAVEHASRGCSAPVPIACVFECVRKVEYALMGME